MSEADILELVISDMEAGLPIDTELSRYATSHGILRAIREDDAALLNVFLRIRHLHESMTTHHTTQKAKRNPDNG